MEAIRFTSMDEHTVHTYFCNNFDMEAFSACVYNTNELPQEGGAHDAHLVAQEAVQICFQVHALKAQLLATKGEIALLKCVAGVGGDGNGTGAWRDTADKTRMLPNHVDSGR